tara:strand:+ start:160 stop:678 length:519 start_codon:yes stop_codon:yes gene_type:complete
MATKKDQKYIAIKTREKEMIEDHFATLRGLLSEEDFQELMKNDELSKKLWGKVERFSNGIRRKTDEEKRKDEENFSMCQYCGLLLKNGCMKEHVESDKCQKGRVIRAVAAVEANIRSNPQQYYTNEPFRHELYKKLGEMFECDEENPIRIRNGFWEVPGSMEAALAAPNPYV